MHQPRTARVFHPNVKSKPFPSETQLLARLQLNSCAELLAALLARRCPAMALTCLQEVLAGLQEDLVVLGGQVLERRRAPSR